MEVLKSLINEFAIFSLPSDQESLEDDTIDQNDGQDEFSFRVNATDPTADGSEDLEADEEESDEDCQCNCPSHKKFYAGGEDDDSLENNDNIEVVDGDTEDETGEDDNTEDDDVDPEDDENQFKFF